MGCAYTGSAGGPTRAEMPIPISAYDAIETDSTETVNIKIPSTNPRTERFILISLSFSLAYFGPTPEARPNYLPPI